jgi:hypothetical protein
MDAMERGAPVAVGQDVTWHHTLKLCPGLVTPGWFDLRPVVDKRTWLDIRGKRCREAP